MTATETAISDPALLRQMALSTVKRKGRKLAPTQPVLPIAPRPIPRPTPTVDSMQLDYSDTDPYANVAPEPPRSMNVDQPFHREEGEISDEAGSDHDTAIPVNATNPDQRTVPLGSLDGRLSLLQRITDGVALPALAANPTQPALDPTTESPSPSTKSNSIHVHQVRPNVPLNQAQYDAAKDSVLDLLGWGVTPEYLVQCGLSRELLYYIFTELNLRLPDNLDTTDIQPYNPSTIKTFSFIEPDALLTEETKPPVSTAISSTIQPHVPATHDLHDIEQLRRQELMARKAVLASRGKRKPTLPTVVPTATGTPLSDVDSFLNNALLPPTASATYTPLKTPSTVTPSDAGSSRSTTPAALQPDVSSPASAAPPQSSDSATNSFNTTPRLSPDDETIIHRYPIRRGMKRPVALDFVDLDADAAEDSPHPDPTRNPKPYQTARRKTGVASFVNVRPAKCVIDLSDSETEEEDGGGAPDATATPTPVPTPTPPFVPRAKLAPPRVVTPLANDSQMARLAQTEKDIEELRQKIARKEQEKQAKKLAKPVSKVSSPPTVSNATPGPNKPTSEAEPLPSPAFSAEPSASVSKLAPASSAEPVGVDIVMSSSAQDSEALNASPQAETATIEPDENHENPMHRDSLFASYPLLRLSLQSSLAGTASPNSAETSTASTPTSTVIPDLKPLREAHLLKQIDPQKVLCQYELSGGSCRDAKCDDVHLSKLDDPRAEPDDEETARFVCSFVPKLPFERTKLRLQELRLSNPSSPLEARVGELLASHQVSLPPPLPT